MKVSRAWLQKYFAESLPEMAALADAFTFHAFEVEEYDADLLDLKVLPDRAGYALSHRGVASELAAILGQPLKDDPLAKPPQLPTASDELSIRIDTEGCARYVGALVRGVKVGPSPAWLKKALESVGARSINNVVDATNYVMLDIGQPLHAFDAAKFKDDDGYAVAVRQAKPGERITTLSGDEYEVAESVMLITDAHADIPVAIAGVKGGKHAEVMPVTTDIIVESANFDGTSVRRAAQRLKLFTDASLRFQNRPSAELAAYGMQQVIALIQSVAGGEIVGIGDAYPSPATISPVHTSLARINGRLGTSYTAEEVESVFSRLALPYTQEGETYVITPPFQRTDLTIPDDIAEEVGRILGYDRLPETELPTAGEPDQSRFRGIERMKDQLVEQGFTEVSTQSFAKKGDVELANPLDTKMPALRTSLEKNLADALIVAKQYAPLVLPPNQKPKLFEVGTVFPKEGEHMELRMSERVAAWGESVGTVDDLSKAKLEEYGKDYAPKRYELGQFALFSAYPFIVRDVAAWAPQGSDERQMFGVIREMLKSASSPSLAIETIIWQLDTYTKDNRTSFALRLVLNSFTQTLTDEEANGIMEKIHQALRSAGYEIR